MKLFESIMKVHTRALWSCLKVLWKFKHKTISTRWFRAVPRACKKGAVLFTFWAPCLTAFKKATWYKGDDWEHGRWIMFQGWVDTLTFRNLGDLRLSNNNMKLTGPRPGLRVTMLQWCLFLKDYQVNRKFCNVILYFFSRCDWASCDEWFILLLRKVARNSKYLFAEWF